MAIGLQQGRAEMTFQTTHFYKTPAFQPTENDHFAEKKN